MRKMTIGDLAKASGVHLETIRYYERIGLIRKPPRAAGGYRLYETADLARLRFIRCGRALGFGLEKVQTLLTLQDAQGGSCERVRAIAQEQIKALHAKVTQFLWMKETLSRMVAYCPADPSPTDSCPILDDMNACEQKCNPVGCGCG